MRREIEKRIKKQRTELEVIEKGIIELNEKKVIANAVLNELESLLKTLPKEDGEPVQEKQLRNGTDVYRAREILRIWREPLYIDRIIGYMNEEVTPDRRRSLASQIAAYVRENQIFTRPEPNTFGLKEFENQSSDVVQIGNEGGEIQGETPDFPF